STLKSPSYTKSVSWQHYPVIPHKYWRTLDISFATENSK
ncbi:transposase, partial [Shigella flexneri]